MRLCENIIYCGILDVSLVLLEILYNISMLCRFNLIFYVYFLFLLMLYVLILLMCLRMFLYVYNVRLCECVLSNLRRCL